MNEKSSQVLLITGPGGSGKTALASSIAEQLGWVCIEEDNYWLENGWRNKRRTIEREETVQQQALEDLQDACGRDKSVVLEFLLYKTPPNSLTTYTNFLDHSSIPYNIVALKPTPEELIRRIQKRGRETEISELTETRSRTERQLKYLDPNYIKHSWVVDSTNMTVDTLVGYCLKLVQP